MKDRVAFRSSEEGFAQSRLPAFSEEEVAFIKGSSDFVGINHYTTMLVGDAAEKVFDSTHRDNDMKAWFAQDPSWEGGKSYWLKVKEEQCKVNLLFFLSIFVLRSFHGDFAKH